MNKKKDRSMLFFPLGQLLLDLKVLVFPPFLFWLVWNISFHSGYFFFFFLKNKDPLWPGFGCICDSLLHWLPAEHSAFNWWNNNDEPCLNLLWRPLEAEAVVNQASAAAPQWSQSVLRLGVWKTSSKCCALGPERVPTGLLHSHLRTHLSFL